MRIHKNILLSFSLIITLSFILVSVITFTGCADSSGSKPSAYDNDNNSNYDNNNNNTTENTAPKYVSFAIEHSTKNQIVVKFNENIITTDSGYIIEVNGSPVTIIDYSGGETNTITFTINTTISFLDTVSIAYDETVGDAVDLADTPNPLASFSASITNYISVYKSGKTFDGYTLLTPVGGHENPPGSGIYNYVILIDMEGALVNEWAIVGFPAKMLPNGHIMGYHAKSDHYTHTDYIVVLDWFGNEVWRWGRWAFDNSGNPVGHGHHDHQREGNPVGYYIPDMDAGVDGGNTLMLVHDYQHKPEISSFTLEDDVIIEVDYDGNILWEWHGCDHFDEFGFDDDAKLAIQVVPAGLHPPWYIGTTDWLHINNINYLGPNKWWDDGNGDERFNPENIIADSRNTNITWIIEKATGNIVWKIGPNYYGSNPESKLDQIVGQHHAHMIPRGLPGEGNILVFDNGGAAGFGVVFGIPTWLNVTRLYSRVIEFNPVTLDIVWEYTEPFFFSYYISSAQRLPNGNTLITEGSTGRVFEVTPGKEIVWEYVSPYYDSSLQNHNYRAYRMPYDYIPEDLLADPEEYRIQ